MKIPIFSTLGLIILLLTDCKKKELVPKSSKITNIISHVSGPNISKEITVYYGKDKNQLKEVLISNDYVVQLYENNQYSLKKDSYRFFYSYINNKVSKISMYSNYSNQIIKTLNVKYISNNRYNFDLNIETIEDKKYNPYYTIEVETEDNKPRKLNGKINPKYPEISSIPFDELNIEYDKNGNVIQSYLTNPSFTDLKLFEKTEYDTNLQNPLYQVQDLWLLNFFFTPTDNILTVQAVSGLNFNFTDFFSKNCITNLHLNIYHDSNYKISHSLDTNNRIIEKRYSIFGNSDYTLNFQYSRL